jgi:inosine-uridine nucleoside N-ribohydrolase
MTTAPAVGIIFDTGLSRADDALAMALLYGFDGKKVVRVVSISTGRTSLQAATFCDVVSRFYAGAVSGAIGFNGRTLPVGLAAAGSLKEDLPLFAAPLARRDASGKAVYTSDIHTFEDTADPASVIRNAFTAQFNNNAIVVLSGPATSLAKLLDIGDAKALIARKVKLLVFAGGAFPDGEPEFNVKADISAARKVFAEWPTPIVMSGQEVGKSLLFPGASIDKDFAWSSAHPVVDAYRASQPMPYDAPTSAMAAVLYAAQPQEGYFKLSDPGTVSVMDDGRTRFAGSPSGKHRYLVLDPAQTDRILKAYTEVASAKPVPPAPRRPRIPVQQEPPKPAAGTPTPTPTPAAATPPPQVPAQPPK